MGRQQVFPLQGAFHGGGLGAHARIRERVLSRQPGGVERVAQYQQQQERCPHGHSCRHPVPTGPLERLLQEARRLGQDRLPAQHPIKVVGQGLRRGVALHRLLLHGLGHDHGQILGQPWDLGGQGEGVLLQHAAQQVSGMDIALGCGAGGAGRGMAGGSGPRGVPEGRSAGQHGVECGTQAIDVGAEVDRGGPCHLLRSHEIHRPHQQARAGEAAFLVSREAKVRKQGLEALLGLLDENVGGLHIAVDEAHAVGGAQAASCLGREGDLHPPVRVRVEVSEGLALHQLEEDAGAAFQGSGVVHPHHMRVFHPRLEAGLQQQPFSLLGIAPPDEFDGHRAFERSIPGAVDLPHAPDPQDALEGDAPIERG